MAESALIVVVPDAEPFVKHLRERFDPSATLNVPAHITVLYPFVLPDLLSENVFERLEHPASGTTKFEFGGACPARFPDVLYLKREPVQRFIELTLRVAREFPEYTPYRGQAESVVPHLSVAKGRGVAVSCRRAAIECNSSTRRRDRKVRCPRAYRKQYRSMATTSRVCSPREIFK